MSANPLKAANGPDYLLDHARSCGLREAMHAVPPTQARELLQAFVCLIDKERAEAKAEERNEWKEAVLDALANWPGMDFPTDTPPKTIIDAILKIEREAAVALAEPMTEPFVVTGTTADRQRAAIVDAGHVLTYDRAFELGQRYCLSSHNVQALAREIVAAPGTAANDSPDATPKRPVTEAEFIEWFGKNYYGEVVFGDPAWHARSIYRRLAGRPATFTLDARQLSWAAEFAAPDFATDEAQRDTQLTFAVMPARVLEGEDCPAGLYAWLSDYPEEGCMHVESQDEFVARMAAEPPAAKPEPATFSPEWFAGLDEIAGRIRPVLAEARATLHSAIAKFAGQWPAEGDTIVFEGTTITRAQFEAVAA